MINNSKDLDRTTVRFFYSMLQSAVSDKPLKEIPRQLDLDSIYYYAHLNSLTGLLYYSIYKNKLPISHELNTIWKKELYETIFYTMSLKEYWKDLKQVLDGLDINYIPVKGAVIQNYYSKPGMRSMSDYDIIYRYREEEIRDLNSNSIQKIKSLDGTNGIRVTADGGIVDSIFIDRQFLFELHREFLGSDKPGHDYYHNIWTKTEKTIDPHEFQINDSEQFILMLVHSNKHYSEAGCGPKELVDYYVFKNNPSVSLDWPYIYSVLNQFNLTSYEELLNRLTKIIFENMEGSESDWIELEKWLKAGTYGNYERRVNNIISNYTDQGYSLRKAKFCYLLRRLYPPMEFLKDQYPFFYTHPVFKPILPLYRMVKNPDGIFEKIKGELEFINKFK